MLPPTVPLIWKRSTRARRITLRIEPVRGEVIITVPERISRDRALAFVHQQTEWITNALAALPEKQALADGSEVMIEGRSIPILHEPTARRGCWLDAEGLHVSGEATHTERRVRDFLQAMAKERLTQTLQTHSAKMDLHPARLDLRDVRTRWGSCTRQGRIMLSWRLLMAPTEIRDYVVIHELAHLKHFNHGPDFWALVDRFIPQGRTGRLAAERWLRENGTVLLRAA
ncbi:MAG: SprT family zinc-dependent metalloprotease [Gluconobacter potus]|uniref:M48 family metallopeptidase n=1 Tax=Gluconobacter potus TaxID=2724927 RepID=A0ABR9YP93_9PROT|nr:MULTISPECIES: SprT family zinc-dependent metalloprotease [Gluconobacter]MBF0865524.1 M48 family metallopeptidase [Gluconobacter sp. R71656]MBF0868497.1 M48 family metallopeptidase [Gluconobacter sp. R75628]MBF0874536.1 M48 family metallopeptidase [Gluconobacter sp. R75629]MBF0883611.1 M48 family metallopeptidase [Gluconobacter potus]